MKTGSCGIRPLLVMTMVLAATGLAGAQDPTTTTATESKPVTTEGIPATQATGSDGSREVESAPDRDQEGLRMNFRGVSLDLVLDYLSRAAGFVIVRQADIEGTIDAWSHQPLTTDEAVDFLNTVLNEKGLAAIRNGRTLLIVNRDEAKTHNLPVRTGSDPDGIPQTDEMVTQVVPVRYADVKQLLENIEPLLPEYAVVSANEGSNALILTDTQVNVRRIAEIVQALDTSISEISRIQVFPLEYAEAPDIAEVINSIFEEGSASSQSGSGDRERRIREFFSRMRGGRGGGPPGMPSGGESTGGSSEARQAQTSVVAVADERTNSVVVRASEELMPTVEELVEEIDTVVEDEMMVRVFPLEFADAAETAEMVTDVFAVEDQSSTANRGDRRQRTGGDRGNRGGAQSQQVVTDETVTAKADVRTNSVVVRAASSVMDEVEEMVLALDGDPAKDKKVFVYPLENANAEELEIILEGLFGESANQQNNSTTSNNTSTRNTNQTSRQTGSGFGSLR